VDSSAILALLLNEPGGERIESLVAGSLLCTLNLCEVHSRLLKLGVPKVLSWRQIIDLHCELCQFSPEHARVAAEMAALTRKSGLSLGDRACLALAMERKAKVYTADRLWKNLSLGIEIEVIR
jgi:PIN domain nuclease of toxin-antitoxin system